MDGPAIRRFEPLAEDWRSFAWPGGTFDMARRQLTPEVEGAIRAPYHLLLVTLRGGAARLEVQAEDGHRYAGGDRAGAVSFVPAGCARQARLGRVRAAWASLAIAPGLLPRGGAVAAFTNRADPFLAAAIGEMARLHAADGGLEAPYCETMTLAVASYLERRHGAAPPACSARYRLPAWRLKRLADHVEANLGGELLIADLAAAVGLSAGHLHRAFRATTGTTPLAFIHERRIRRAADLLAEGGVSVTEAALRVGYLSPSHFARTFRQVMGTSPARFRKERGR